MINCRNCVNWVDESLEQIEADTSGRPHIFLGCRIFGYPENTEALESCEQYRQSDNLFTICKTCRIAVPKVCVSLCECLNCTDTDLFCVDHCIGGDNRKYCTHFVRIHSEGVHLVSGNRTFDLFPKIGMPGQKPEEGAGNAGAREVKDSATQKE
jgi:hypothetical protein